MADTATQPGDSSMLAQILLKQGEMGVQLAVITEQLKTVPDHEGRIRALERFRYTIAGLSLIGGTASGFLGYWIGHVARLVPGGTGAVPGLS
jgi:hypothetical protein